MTYESIFSQVFAQSPEAIVLTRAQDGVMVEVNAEWVRLTGYPREDALGRTAMELGHWQSEAEHDAVLASLKKGGAVRDADVTLVMRDGMARVVRMTATVVDAPGGPFVLFYLRDVTAERLSQEALRAGERLLADTNERLNRQVKLYEVTEAVAKVGHWVIYPGDSTVHCSPGYAEMVGSPHQRVVPEDNRHSAWILEEDREVFKQARRTMDGQTIEYRWRHPDGGLRWARSRLHKQVENGVAKADFGIIQDITAEKLALKALVEREERFRSLTELSSDWYWEQDEHFRFVRVDGNLEAKNALPGTDYIGKTRWESGAEGLSAEGWELHKATLAAHEVFHDFEIQRRRTDGSLMWVSLSGTPVFNESGEFCGYRGTGRDISARKEAEMEIERLAFYDSLTGLPNRRLLMDRLSQALHLSARHMSHGALLFIDLDNFKMLNDTLGHHMGDELLKQVAQRLCKCVRGADTVARLGGDEFVVMLEDIGATPQDAARQAELVGKKVLTSLNYAYELADRHHHTSPSIGITLFYQHMHTVDELLQRADLAMYQAKSAGRNTLRFFDPVMQAAASARATLELDLRQGLLRNEFLLYYQPVVNEHRAMTGVEALLRWKHPTRGMVSPVEFIPVAEQTGLILSLGLWVLETACAQLVAWSMQASTRNLSIAVNVSARQFRQAEFSDQLLTVLRLSGANPYRLKLELTESLLLNEMDDAIVKMSELRSIGVSFSLDDFGTGYSSLSYLKRLPLDVLKIDQSFVRDVLTDPNDAAIAKTILDLAANLDLNVVAEGVETEGQREFLLKAGCKAFQGYLFGRPVPIAELVLG